MDTKTLIAFLQAMPQDAPVKISEDNGYVADSVLSVRFDDVQKRVLLDLGGTGNLTAARPDKDFQAVGYVEAEIALR